MEHLDFIESKADYKDVVRRIAALRKVDSDGAREEVKRLTELIRRYRNPMPRKERAKLTETIQQLIDEGALKGMEDDEIW